ncbi:hypothetical protein HYX01_03900 [Candidatus Woesearchaeota archaeon]|nr:hypothetical protein [Candidatus Woesearchaeota archaeon]
MVNEDIDDIFKDFEDKVEEKKGAYKSEGSILDKKKILEQTYDAQKKALEEKQRKEQKALQEEELKRALIKKNFSSKPFNSKPVNIERLGYIAIILVLAAYIIIDLSFYHGSKNADMKENAASAIVASKMNDTLKVKDTSAAVKLINDTLSTINKSINKSIAAKEEPNETIAITEKKETKDNGTLQEEKKLSGVIALAIDKIDTEIVNRDDDTGRINSVTITINNGKDKVLVPVVDVYAYDSKMDESWQTKSRVNHIYGTGIKSGDEYTVSLDLTPKTFRNINFTKTIRVTLNDTKTGFITVAKKEIMII